MNGLTPSKRIQKTIMAFAEQFDIDLNNVGDHVLIEREGPYDDLAVEVIGSFSGYSLVSVAFYHEQNGDLMADPEIVFWATPFGWYAVSYQNSGLGLYQVAINTVENWTNRGLHKSIMSYVNKGFNSAIREWMSEGTAR